jgi:para-nitrobenzyl esterase
MANDVATADAGRSPVVEIATGKLRGTSSARIYSLKGMPYGALPGGRNRFLPPQPPLPWAGVRDATAYVGRAWQLPNRPKRRAVLETLLGPADTTAESEDCLTLNLWTPALGDGARRPVMVWLHGGAFGYGSGNRAVTDGVNLSRRGDIVVVSVNHRLNIFGFLHLPDFVGPDWAHSGNAGVLDLVAALRWVRDNMRPSAATLVTSRSSASRAGAARSASCWRCRRRAAYFHRAIVQSGAATRVSTRERANALAEAAQKELGVGGNGQLQTVPPSGCWRRLRRPRARSGAPVGRCSIATISARLSTAATCRSIRPSRGTRHCRRHSGDDRAAPGRRAPFSSPMTTRYGTVPSPSKSCAGTARR